MGKCKGVHINKDAIVHGAAKPRLEDVREVD
jgi:hypothetical protein